MSDHYPIELVLAFAFNQVCVAEDKTMPDQTRVNWKKVDHDLYASLVSERLLQVLVNSNSVYDLERAVHSVNHTLAQCAIEAAPRQQRRPRKAKLRTWKPEIKSAVSEKKAAFHQWKIAGKPQEEGNLLLAQKKLTSKVLRQLCRKENAQQYIRDKQEILDAKIQDVALFHKLINKHRGSLGVFLNELHVGDSTFRTDGEILQGWRQHFGDLAKQSSNPRFDEKYKRIVDMELGEIIDICKSSSASYSPVTVEEVEEAIGSLNKGKAADVFGLTTEHLSYASADLIPVLTTLLNGIFHVGELQSSLKLGLLTPVFKKKGSNLDSKNYRGITILPILSKLLECFLRDRIKPYIEEVQNPMQRGFTKNSSPMNCSLILEEYIRENKDLKRDTFVAFLDAKAAFDVVNHASLMRKL